jgi:hypothetical protein
LGGHAATSSNQTGQPQAKLNCIDASLYPIGRFFEDCGAAAPELAEQLAAALPAGGGVIAGRDAARYVLVPAAKAGLDFSDCREPDSLELLQAQLRQERCAGGGTGGGCAVAQGACAEARARGLQARRELPPPALVLPRHRHRLVAGGQ